MQGSEKNLIRVNCWNCRQTLGMETKDDFMWPFATLSGYTFVVETYCLPFRWNFFQTSKNVMETPFNSKSQVNFVPTHFFLIYDSTEICLLYMSSYSSGFFIRLNSHNFGSHTTYLAVDNLQIQLKILCLMSKTKRP